MSNQDLILGLAGRRIREKMARLYPSLRDGKVTIETKHMPVPEALDDVQFASKAAYRLADKVGFTWADFSGSSQGASSERGYTLADVRAVIEEKDDSPG